MKFFQYVVESVPFEVTVQIKRSAHITDKLIRLVPDDAGDLNFDYALDMEDDEVQRRNS
ncbi:unnamed protein product, partial [Heterosigma akashiwo]